MRDVYYNVRLPGLSRALGILLLLSLLCLFGTTASAVTINFDEIDTSKTGISSVSDEFADLGVIFSLIDANGVSQELPVVSDPLFGNGATTLPNGASFGFQGLKGVATFVDPLTGEAGVTNLVSALVGDRSGEADEITIIALDIFGQEIGRSSFTSQPNNILGFDDFGFVRIIAEGIHQIIFLDESPSGASFDDFTFNTVLRAEIEVPEPSSVCLLTAALLGAIAGGCIRRRYLANGRFFGTFSSRTLRIFASSA